MDIDNGDVKKKDSGKNDFMTAFLIVKENIIVGHIYIYQVLVDFSRGYLIFNFI